MASIDDLPDDDLPDDDLPDGLVLFGADHHVTSDPSLQAIAADVLGRLPQTAQVRTVDPKLLWNLAGAVASILASCAMDHMQNKLARVKARPNGPLAVRLTRRIADQLPAAWAEDRHELATAMVEAGKEAVDDPDRWATLISARGAALAAHAPGT